MLSNASTISEGYRTSLVPTACASQGVLEKYFNTQSVLKYVLRTAHRCAEAEKNV
jgi:hypothetical protein